jgi:lincosamide nucleotidyltransferase A/C/D/E
VVSALRIERTPSTDLRAALAIRHDAQVNTDPEIRNMSAEDVVALCDILAQHHVGSWVMGGWGVDALLGRQTRPHHDLDLLLSYDDLAPFQDLLREEGFSRTLIWEGENRWVPVRGVQTPTAFVEMDSRGRELDIHVIQLAAGQSAPVPMCDVPWSFNTRSLFGGGTIAGAAIRCVSADTQLQMHTGYDLPSHHERDVERLCQLVAATTEGRS